MAVKLTYRPRELTWEEFARVDRECFADEPVGPAGFAERLAGEFWAAHDAEALVGYAFLDNSRGLGWLRRIGVAAGYRRRGTGRLLMQAAVDRCEALGLADVMLYVLSDNAAARGLYEGFGFRAVESAWQYIAPVSSFAGGDGEALAAVPWPEIEPSVLPELPAQWADLAARHDPPHTYVLGFRGADGGLRGYCRLSPAFPGCFPFVLDDPRAELLPALCSLRPYLLPEHPILKLTFAGDALASACASRGFELHYRLLKMVRPRGPARRS